MTQAIVTTMNRLVLGAIALTLAATHGAAASEFVNTWRDSNSAIVLDAYEYTPIDWEKLPQNKRLAGFINKASDGLQPKFRCRGDRHCRTKWRRYAATKELYRTRRAIARMQGLKWGAYHLARPGNPIKQAEHFLQFTRPDKDDLLALDIEHDDPKKWMSLADAEIFARHIKKRTGRYPMLYTNHHTSKAIAAQRDRYPLLSRLNLWYARYKTDMRGAFPMGNWDSYTIWQFSSMVNCNDRSCPMRIKGAGNWIDVNVVAMSPAEMKAQWPFAALRADEPKPQSAPQPNTLLVSAKTHARDILLAQLPVAARHRDTGAARDDVENVTAMNVDQVKARTAPDRDVVAAQHIIMRAATTHTQMVRAAYTVEAPRVQSLLGQLAGAQMAKLARVAVPTIRPDLPQAVPAVVTAPKPPVVAAVIVAPKPVVANVADAAQIIAGAQTFDADMIAAAYAAEAPVAQVVMGQQVGVQLASLERVALPIFRTSVEATPLPKRAKKSAGPKPKYTPEQVAAYKRFLKRQAAIRAARRAKAAKASRMPATRPAPKARAKRS